MKRSAYWDAVRGISILTMIAIHTNFLVGWEPFHPEIRLLLLPCIDPIFFLSGFLIVSRLLKYHTPANGSLRAISDYLARRVLRTWPAYFFLVIFAFAFPALLEAPLTKPAWAFFTFTMNWRVAFGGLMHLWSLCLEEWCYLLLACLLPFIRRPFAPGVLAAFALSAVIGRFLLVQRNGGPLPEVDYFSQIHFSTWNNWDSFWWGAVAGWLYRAEDLLKLPRRVKAGMLALGCASLALFVFLCLRRTEASWAYLQIFAPWFGTVRPSAWWREFPSFRKKLWSAREWAGSA